MLISKRLQKALDIGPKSVLKLDFAIADQDAFEVPPALQTALKDHPDLADIWNALTPGKRRGLAYRVGSAKAAPTIQKRVEEVLSELMEMG